jgi:hypothetical protein
MTGSTNRRRLAIVLATVGLLSIATVALADHGFTDVPHDSTHEAGIDYVAAAGITQGCTADEYCPNDPLTRAQMGTFLHRSSGHDPDTPPSVNAAELDGQGPSAYTTSVFSAARSNSVPLTTAGSAATAITVVSLGLPAGEYVATGEVSALAFALPPQPLTQDSFVSCALWVDDDEVRRAGTRIGAGDGAVRSTTIPTSAHFTIDEEATIMLRCHTGSVSGSAPMIGGNADGTSTHLIATRVGDAS